MFVFHGCECLIKPHLCKARSLSFLSIKSYGFSCFQLSYFAASIDMVFLELKCTSILFWPSSHLADVKVRIRKSKVGSRKSEVGSPKSEVRESEVPPQLSYLNQWSFHVVALQRTAKKCTKIKNARAKQLFFLIEPIVLRRCRCGRRRRRCLSCLILVND